MNMPCLRAHKASYSTFLRAFAAVKGEFGLKGLKLKLSTGKGNLERCDICTNADELLKISLSNAWSKEERDIIIYYRSKHLVQQWRERDKLASNILAARDLEHGLPVQAVFYFDGMTCITGEILDAILYCYDCLIRFSPGNTPFYGIGSLKNCQMGTRIIGVQVVCGPIDETFLYYTDNMVKSGANVMIEVQRRGMSTCFARCYHLGLTTCCVHAALAKLAEKLKAIDLSMPPKIVLQCDNCRENKVSCPQNSSSIDIFL